MGWVGLLGLDFRDNFVGGLKERVSFKLQVLNCAGKYNRGIFDLCSTLFTVEPG